MELSYQINIDFSCNNNAQRMEDENALNGILLSYTYINVKMHAPCSPDTYASQLTKEKKKVP